MQDNKIICSTDQLIGPMKNKPMADYLKSNVKSAPYPDLQTKNVHLEQHEHGPFIHSAAGDIGSSLGYCLANINR